MIAALSVCLFVCLFTYIHMGGWGGRDDRTMTCVLKPACLLACLPDTVISLRVCLSLSVCLSVCRVDWLWRGEGRVWGRVRGRRGGGLMGVCEMGKREGEKKRAAVLVSKLSWEELRPGREGNSGAR